jgi:hypothetical protein
MRKTSETLMLRQYAFDEGVERICVTMQFPL